MAPAATASQPYTPRDPGNSVIAKVLEYHLDDFLEGVHLNGGDGDPNWSVPTFVERELRAIMDCGDYTKGFVLLKCATCRQGQVVPFSCKGRLCPSCSARRMSETAAFLVDRVLSPACRYRQWVLTFPWALRRALAFDSGLANAVFALVGRTILGWVRRCAEDDGVHGQPAGILQVQRAADAAMLNVHLHLLVSEGVFTRSAPDGEVRVHRTRVPQAADIADLVAELEVRVGRLVERRARDVADCDEDAPPDARRLLLQCAASPAVRRRDEQAQAEGAAATNARPRHAKSALCVTGEEGFNLHAGVVIKAGDKPGLERMCRYLGRPPVAESRLQMLDDGKIAVDLKRAWAGDVVRQEFEPEDFIARLAAIVPPPGFHMLRYLGAIAPHAKIRAHVVPRPRPPDPGKDGKDGKDPVPTGPLAPCRPARMAWADLLARVFAVDVFKCSCGGRLHVVATIQDPTVIQAVAASLMASGRLAPRRGGTGPPGRRGRFRFTDVDADC